MSDYKHKPFTELWFTARNDNGNNPRGTRDESAAYHADYSEYIDDVADNPEWPLTLYKAEVEWVPYKRIYEDECGFIEEKLLIHPAGGPVSKIERLQSAVREMLYEVNLYQQQENEHRIRKESLDTIETYGLTEKDME